MRRSRVAVSDRDQRSIRVAEHFRAAPAGRLIRRRGDIGANPGLGGHPGPGDLDRPEVGRAATVRAHRTGKMR